MVKAVADLLERIIAAMGLAKFGAKGDEFDLNVHEALMHGHSPDAYDHHRRQQAHAGYRIGDRVVRAAKVTVLDPEPGGRAGGRSAGGRGAGPAVTIATYPSRHLGGGVSR